MPKCKRTELEAAVRHHSVIGLFFLLPAFVSESLLAWMMFKLPFPEWTSTHWVVFACLGVAGLITAYYGGFHAGALTRSLRELDSHESPP